MAKHRLSALDRFAIGLSLSSIVDRAIKLGLVAHFFSRRQPAEPACWPSVTILQPVTQGAAALRMNLEARAQLDYPARVQHVLLCDAADACLQATCQEWAGAHPELDVRIVRVKGRDGDGISPATKLAKLQVGLPYATGDVLCLMDDDVAPRRDGRRRLVAYLGAPGVGATFGLACYTNWENLWSSLLSTYVNVYTLENFVSWAYLCGSIRVVGQMACYWRRPFVAAGAFDGLECYLDDDFVLAQRLQQAGLRPLQTPVVYDVNDPAESRRRYAAKFKRWIVLPRQAMEPFMAPWQRVAAFLATPATILLPSVVGAVALVARSRTSTYTLAATLGAFAATQGVSYTRFLRRRMPLRRWPLLFYTVLITPVHAALTLLAGNEVEWRGQRMRVFRDGHFERVA
ncbi:MAG: glycosyltransferase [Ktedonobacterales bacterium]